MPWPAQAGFDSDEVPDRGSGSETSRADRRDADGWELWDKPTQRDDLNPSNFEGPEQSPIRRNGIGSH
jgi:hypothetical protein